jgi:myosin-5
MQFNTRGELIGAKIDTYLLEKVRLATQSKGERNYHVFYQMLQGGSDAERTDWAMEKAEDFHFINQSGCFTLREADDGVDYAALRT